MKPGAVRDPSDPDHSPVPGVEAIGSAVWGAAIDWDAGLRVANARIDRVVEALRKPSRTERIAALNAASEEVKRTMHPASIQQFLGDIFLSGRSPRATMAEKVSLFVVSTTTPIFEAALRSEDSAHAKLQLAIVALALAAYRADHRAYPAKLAELSPKYLSEVPSDPCAGGPLQYRLSGGEYLLYSVGPNGKDDGGHNRFDRDDKETTSEQDDIAVRSDIGRKVR